MPKKAEKTKLGELCLNIKKKCTVEVMRKVLTIKDNSNQQISKALWEVVKPKKGLRILDYKAVREWIMSFNLLQRTSEMVNGENISVVFRLHKESIEKGETDNFKREWKQEKDYWSNVFNYDFDENRRDKLKKILSDYSGDKGKLKKLVIEARDAMKASIIPLIEKAEKEYMAEVDKVKKPKI